MFTLMIHSPGFPPRAPSPGDSAALVITLTVFGLSPGLDQALCTAASLPACSHCHQGDNKA
ncbi:MAG: hypothetical protein RDV48_31190, partial [Candidatus Eremiobacteraeota bacterium]|nr:hypothetical protein [Candidatus Eremiobacteraeota bacterium]